MKPANQNQACQLMAIELRAKVMRVSPAKKGRIIRQGMLIAEILWRHWQVGIYGIRLKHCQWLLETYLQDKEPATRYKYWLWLRDILTATGKYEDWEPGLRGSWRHQSGRPYAPRSTRGRRSKYQLQRPPRTKQT